MKIGVDLVYLPRVRLIAEKRYFSKFVARVLSEVEMKEFELSIDKSVFLAKHFAIKEAVVKALGTGWSSGVKFNDIIIKKTEAGRAISFQNYTKELAEKLGLVSWQVSISDDGDYVVAFVVGNKL